MDIAILGAGSVGGALGKGWARAGHKIRYGVPNPHDKKHAQTAAAANNAAILSVGDAVAASPAIALAVPWDAVPQAIAACGDLAGKLILDATNPLKLSANGLELALGFSTSGGEEVQRLAKGAAVFKTMNQVGFEVMADATGYPTRPAMFVAGDDAKRKPEAMRLVEDLGFEPFDAGPLARARLLEPYAMLWIDQVMAHGLPRTMAFGFMRKG